MVGIEKPMVPNNYPKTRISLGVEVVENEPGKYSVHYSINEQDPTMKDVALLVYKLKQVEQQLLDRIWDGGGEGYEIVENGEERDC